MEVWVIIENYRYGSSCWDCIGTDIIAIISNEAEKKDVAIYSIQKLKMRMKTKLNTKFINIK